MSHFLNPSQKIFEILILETKEKTNSFSKIFPLTEKIEKKIGGRPPRLTISQIVEEFKKYVVSKENLLKNPHLVFNARLLKEAKNNKEHWFWVAKHLPKRVKGLENRWYGSEKSVICFLLLQTGWFNRAEAVELSYRLENLAKERSKQLLSQKAKERMQNEKRRLSLSLKIKEKWKDIEYKNKTIEKLRLSVEKQKLKNSLTKLSKNTLDKLIYEFLEKNYEKIKNKVKVIENPIVEIDEKFRGWLKLKQKEKGSDLYLEYCVLLEPLAALYLLYCLENKKVLLFKELERLDQEFAQLLELVYKKEEDILNLIEKKIELINPK